MGASSWWRLAIVPFCNLEAEGKCCYRWVMVLELDVMLIIRDI